MKLYRIIRIKDIKLNFSQISLITFLCFGLSGCNIIENFLIAKAYDTIKFDQTITNAQVFNCAEKVSFDLFGESIKSESGEYVRSMRNSKKDFIKGVADFGGYDLPNPNMGFRVKAIIKSNELKLKLKAIGFYYSDLGSSEGIINLKNGITNCLNLILIDKQKGSANG